MDAQNTQPARYSSPNSAIRARTWTWWKDANTGSIWVVTDWWYLGMVLNSATILSVGDDFPYNVKIKTLEAKIASGEWVPLIKDKTGTGDAEQK
jgi:hypothetical protein